MQNDTASFKMKIVVVKNEKATMRKLKQNNAHGHTRTPLTPCNNTLTLQLILEVEVEAESTDLRGRG